MIDKLIEKIKPILIKMLSCTAFFICIYLIAWTANGMFGYHFDLNALQNFYMLIVGKQLGEHSINSMFNSPTGQKPN